MPAKGPLRPAHRQPGVASDKGLNVKTGRYLALLLALLLVTACADDTTQGTETPPDSLTIVSHDSFAGGVTDETFAAFTAETGIEVDVVAAGDAGGTVNQAILTRDNPLGDVLFGVDDTFLSRALDEELFVPYESEFLASVDPALVLDPDHRVTPIDFGDVCLNYDIAWFEEAGLEPPQSLDDLVAPEYAGLTVAEDPASSSPGLAFLLATIDRYGSDWPGYWESLVANDVKIVADWETAYYTDFTRYGGDQPVVVSYASSPPAEVIFAETPIDTAPTGVVTDGCYRQVEFAGVLANGEHPQASGRLVDFMLSPEFQATIPTTWFVFPANEEVELPDVFSENTIVPDDPASFDPAEIAANRDDWLDQWRRVVTP
jgi:thiamine transport system substrate-binding protein